MGDRLRVEYWPPTPDVPYLATVARALGGHGVDAAPLRLRDRLRHCDVLHLNWPDLVWAARNPVVRVRSIATVLAARWLARRRGIPFVVTCHNLDQHDRSSRIGDRLQASLIGSADRVVVLSESGIDRLLQRRPTVQRSATVAIPHPLFTDRYRRPSVDDARRSAPFVPDADDDRQIWLTFGKVRPYKGVGPLLESLQRHPELRVRLVVLGERYPRGSQTELLSAVADDERVVHVDRHVTDDEIAAACSLADVVVLPYLRTENSGAALTAITLGVPIVAPAIGIFPDLRAELGECVQLYGPPVDAPFVVAAAERAIAAAPPDAHAFAADEIGRRHAELYRALVDGGDARRRVR